MVAANAQAALSAADVQALSNMGFSAETILVTLMIENNMTASEAATFAAGADSAKAQAYAGAVVAAGRSYSGSAGLAGRAAAPGSSGGTSGGGGGTAVAEAVQDVLDGTDN